ncbi:MAG: N-acetylmuramoyl-L-alanine amidase [Deferrisomatales bacterium]|nr:N-acetylmuramoyl-L-alanine amidase [Deferrisomatales bacterium]
MRKPLGAVCLLLAVAIHGSARAERGTELYEIARAAYYELSAAGPGAADAGAWRRAAQQFEAVPRAAPRSPRAADALYTLGMCQEKAFAASGDESDREAAVAAFLQLTADYPDSNLADDALLRAGRVRELQGQTEPSRQLYRRVVAEYPQRDMAAVARKRLVELTRSTRVGGVRTWSTESYTRVVLDLDHLTPFQAKTLPANPGAGKPPRIFLDLARTRVGPECPSCAQVADGLVRQVRMGQYDPTTVRVVLDLTGASNFRAFPLDSPPRIVVDVVRDVESQDVVADLISRSPAPPVPQPPDAPARPLRIVVDPGHGGKDPGAVGPGGLLEKNVALAMAQELAEELPRRLPCTVKLTRSDDRFLPLEQRTAIANGFGADLFISVHANAARSSRAKGIETYYLDRTSDRAARKMAARENAGTESDLAEMEHILADVILASKIQDSRRLAEAVQRALVGDVSRAYGPVRDLGVKRGPFYVLTGAMMPAILIEASFITHPVEAKRLASARFHRQAATAMAAGVEHFLDGG